MTGPNGEQAGALVSRQGFQVAAHLAAVWHDARLAVGLAGFVRRNRFTVITLARRDDNPRLRKRCAAGERADAMKTAW